MGHVAAARGLAAVHLRFGFVVSGVDEFEGLNRMAERKKKDEALTKPDANQRAASDGRRIDDAPDDIDEIDDDEDYVEDEEGTPCPICQRAYDPGTGDTCDHWVCVA